MKHLFVLIFISISLAAAAEVITMDLTTATDMQSNPITFAPTFGTGYYDCTDVWDRTYSDDDSCQFIYTNNARFMLSHLPSQNSYFGMSWEGFTLSKVSQDTANVFGCVANGGLAGVATPYVIGYYSDWVTGTLGYSSNVILFDQDYYPEYVYICQNSNTMEAITKGNVFNARPFTSADTLALIIGGLDDDMNELTSYTYFLAVDGEMNNAWVKVPLTTIGKVAGLSFRMTTTDIGDYGANTPLYFALDALTVSTESNTGLSYTHITSTACKQLVHNNIVVVRGDETYTLLGQRIK